jgi:hypothetical protein
MIVKHSGLVSLLLLATSREKRRHCVLAIIAIMYSELPKLWETTTA